MPAVPCSLAVQHYSVSWQDSPSATPACLQCMGPGLCTCTPAKRRTDVVQALAHGATRLSLTSTFSHTRKIKVHLLLHPMQGLQACMTPAWFNTIIVFRDQEVSARVLLEEISVLLSKNAIRIVPHEQRSEGFYLRYFLVPKTGGYVPSWTCTSEHQSQEIQVAYTHHAYTLICMVSIWRLVYIDQPKGRIFHVPIYPPHKKYLRFTFQGII